MGSRQPCDEVAAAKPVREPHFQAFEANSAAATARLPARLAQPPTGDGDRRGGLVRRRLGWLVATVATRSDLLARTS